MRGRAVIIVLALAAVAIAFAASGDEAARGVARRGAARARRPRTP